MLKQLKRERWLSSGISVGIIALTVFSSLSHVAWHPYLELTAHFKVQYFLISFIGLSLLLLFQAKYWLVIALFCLGVQLVEILPWYLPATWTTTSTANFRILLSNVYVRNQNPHKFLNLVAKEQPNLVIVQEKTPFWLESLQPLHAQFPYFFQAPDDIAIFSQIPLEQPTIFGGVNQSSLAVTLTIDDRPVQVVTTHPPPPKPTLTASRNQEFEWVANYIQQQRGSIILIGDLNTTMWSPYYNQLKRKTGLVNGRQGFGILPTWPAPTPYTSTSSLLAFFKPFLWIPIDHCLVSPEIGVRSLRTGANIDSDHLPLVVDVFIPAQERLESGTS